MYLGIAADNGRVGRDGLGKIDKTCLVDCRKHRFKTATELDQNCARICLCQEADL